MFLIRLVICKMLRFDWNDEKTIMNVLMLNKNPNSLLDWNEFGRKIGPGIVAHEVGPTGGTGAVESLQTCVECVPSGTRATRGNARLAVQIRVGYPMESDIPIRQPCGARLQSCHIRALKIKNRRAWPKLYKCLFFNTRTGFSHNNKLKLGKIGWQFKENFNFIDKCCNKIDYIII